MALNLEITSYKAGDKPEIRKMPKELLTHLKEEGIRDMVDKHYEYLKKSSIKHLFPIHSEEMFSMVKKNSADFFIQLCGGEQYYKKHRGEPMMKKRHMPFKIDQKARVVWLTGFAEVIKTLDAPEEVLNNFWKYLDPFSAWMLNSK